MYRSTSGAMSYPMMWTVLLVFFVAIHVSAALGQDKGKTLEVFNDVERTSKILGASVFTADFEPGFVKHENGSIAEVNSVNEDQRVLRSNVDLLRPNFQAAVKYYKANTCIRFREITKEEARNGPHIEVVNDGRCFSLYGHQFENHNNLSLGLGCRWMATILHELGHALKFAHTQSRYDRDNYLKLNLNNVNASEQYNYAKLEKADTENYGLPYDLLSIMQYEDGGFAIDTSISVMTPRNPLYKNSMGRNFELTFIDLKMLNRFYNCPESCKHKIKCKNSGFQNSNKCDECVCPSGFGGPNCNVRAGSDDPSTDCGKTLKATSKKWSTLNATFDSSCTWWINAGKKKHVEIQFLDVAIDSNRNCEQAGLDVKLEDPLLTGFRICKTMAIPNVDKFVSKDNRAILRAYVNEKRSQHFTIRYRQVN